MKIYPMALLFCSCLCFLCSAEEADFAFGTFEHDDNKLLYRLYTSPDFQKDRKHALILTLHGSSLRGNDNRAQLKKDRGPLEIKAFVESQRINASILSPQCPSGERWVETPWYGESHTMPPFPNPTMKTTIALLKSLISSSKIDSKRVYVTGLSLGGFGCWDIIQREPNLFAAAIPICGGGDPQQASQLINMPIWIFHGDSDHVVLTKRSRDMYQALKALNAPVLYTEYPNTGHDSFTPTYNNNDIMDWLFKQTRK